jgi:hypothetical protein
MRGHGVILEATEQEICKETNSAIAGYRNKLD